MIQFTGAVGNDVDCSFERRSMLGHLDEDGWRRGVTANDVSKNDSFAPEAGG